MTNEWLRKHIAADPDDSEPSAGSAEPPATDDLVTVLGNIVTSNAHIMDVLHRARALIKRQAREIADKRAMLQNTNRDAARLAHLADKYKWQVRDTCTRAERAEQKLRDVAQGVRISIPTETMEQEFATHYRRGYEAGQAECDALRECVRELVACADESDSLVAERLYGKPHTPEYKTRELDHRQRSIEAWKAARAKVR